MALTPASILADYTSGIGTQGATLKVNTSDKRIGIGTTNPQGTLQVGTGITMGSGIITATSADFSGNVSVGGVLTYEDVTNVDSVGVITARNGIRVGAGQSIGSDGALTYYGNGFNLTGIDATAIKDSAGGTVRVQANTSGAVVTGILTVTTGAVVTGILTATTLEQTQTYPTIRPTLDLNFAATKALDRRITFTRDSLGTYVDELGVIKYASNNVPRFDHDPTTGESLGLLIEESRTNDVAHSDPANAVWIVDNGMVKTANTTDTKAPDGSFTATKLASQAAGPSYSQMYDTLNKSSGGVQSVWAKKGTHNVLGLFDFQGVSGIRGWFDLNTGEHRCEGGSKVAAGVQSNGDDTNNTNMVEYPNGWYRCMYYESANMTYLYFRIADFDSDGEASSASNTIYLWGAQAEVDNTFATSFIPSLSAAMPATNSTRAEDYAKITGTNFTDFYNATESAISVRFNMYGYTNTGFNRVYEISDGTVSNRTLLANNSTNATFYENFIINGSNSISNESEAITFGNFYNYTASFKKNDYQRYLNVDGTLEGHADSSIAINNFSPTQIIFGGHLNSSTNGILNGHISYFKYYPKRLPNAQLQGLIAT